MGRDLPRLFKQFFALPRTNPLPLGKQRHHRATGEQNGPYSTFVVSHARDSLQMGFAKAAYYVLFFITPAPRRARIAGMSCQLNAFGKRLTRDLFTGVNHCIYPDAERIPDRVQVF